MNKSENINDNTDDENWVRFAFRISFAKGGLTFLSFIPLASNSESLQLGEAGGRKLKKRKIQQILPAPPAP